MAHKELNSKADFDAAISSSSRFAFVYFYDGTPPAGAEEKSAKFAATTDVYKVDLSKNSARKEHFGIEHVPSAIVYKGGKELKRIDTAHPEDKNEIAALLSG